ncbi:hypothetical protein [Tenacibaculum sp. 190524A05c]|uniref:Uncharacterized protein n=1 Tax=Tenacibaculum platacis TaxID=3137852 RepID=A0ABP1EW99_9FLAO
MKLLKLVLIALVTVGIYSFTTVEKTKYKPIDKVEKLVQYDGCFSLIYNSRATSEQKRLARKWIEKSFSIALVNLNETTIINGKTQEKWDYVNIRDRADLQEDEDDKEDDWKIGYTYLSSYSMGCENSFTYLLN